MMKKGRNFSDSGLGVRACFQKFQLPRRAAYESCDSGRFLYHGLSMSEVSDIFDGCEVPTDRGLTVSDGWVADSPKRRSFWQPSHDALSRDERIIDFLLHRLE